MWRIIFIAAIPCVFGAATRQIEPLEGPLWSERLAESLTSFDDVPSFNPDLVKQRYQYENARDSDSAEDSTFVRPSSEKRALAMFARWGTINSIGKNRTPIRSQVLSEPQPGISAQTRSRILGQPLRWG